MTREEIDQVLDMLIRSDDRGVSAPMAFTSALARIVADQEHRLRVLEPCAARVAEGQAHAWGHFEPAPNAFTCRYCGITKEPPR